MVEHTWLFTRYKLWSLGRPMLESLTSVLAFELNRINRAAHACNARKLLEQTGLRGSNYNKTPVQHSRLLLYYPSRGHAAVKISKQMVWKKRERNYNTMFTITSKGNHKYRVQIIFVSKKFRKEKLSKTYSTLPFLSPSGTSLKRYRVKHILQHNWYIHVSLIVSNQGIHEHSISFNLYIYIIYI